MFFDDLDDIHEIVILNDVFFVFSCLYSLNHDHGDDHDDDGTIDDVDDDVYDDRLFL